MKHKDLNLKPATKAYIQSKNVSARNCEVCSNLIEVLDVRKPARLYCKPECRSYAPSKRMNFWMGKSTPTIRQGPFGNAQNNYLKPKDNK